jgi:ATP-dependent Lon protease
VLPKQNESELRKLPDHVRADMDLVLAGRIEDVLAAAVPGLKDRLVSG